jgi:OOP family OmpA-OmpF porin
VTIEGHTDSYGGDDLNQKLSEDRANAVRQYFIANMNLKAEDVEAVGYGESRPIANNETPEGRARNRRIDIVIQTQIARR